MSGRFLLDTNTVIANAVFVPVVVLGELYYGARKSARAEANMTRIEELAASAAVLSCDLVTAQQYGRIKNDLRAKGRPITGERHLDCSHCRATCPNRCIARRPFRQRDGPAAEAW
jgi:predicted nucleic acid-binding protein